MYSLKWDNSPIKSSKVLNKVSISRILNFLRSMTSLKSLDPYVLPFYPPKRFYNLPGHFIVNTPLVKWLICLPVSFPLPLSLRNLLLSVPVYFSLQGPPSCHFRNFMKWTLINKVGMMDKFLKTIWKQNKAK